MFSPLPFCFRRKTKWSQFSCIWPVIDSPITITYRRKKKTFLVIIYILIVSWLIAILHWQDQDLSLSHKEEAEIITESVTILMILFFFYTFISIQTYISSKDKAKN